MRVLFAGDYRANTGPSTVNRYLKRYLPPGTGYLNQKNAFFKAAEAAVKTLWADVIIFSGLSGIDSLVFRIARAFHKKTIYIMHGSVAYENKINEISNPGEEKLEEIHLTHSDMILCVSETFMDWMHAHYPELKGKTRCLPNGIDWRIRDECKSAASSAQKRQNTIMTIGGGIPRKNVLPVCRAVQFIRETEGMDLKLLVLGRDEKHTEKIKAFEFVEYMGKLDRSEALKHYFRARLFIQNSLFDTFGMAPIEALLSGCSILLSRHVGAASVMQGIEKNDIIEDCQNEKELARKILNVLRRPNNDRLLSGIDEEKTSFEHRAKQLYRYAADVCGGPR